MPCGVLLVHAYHRGCGCVLPHPTHMSSQTRDPRARPTHVWLIHDPPMTPLPSVHQVWSVGGHGVSPGVTKLARSWNPARSARNCLGSADVTGTHPPFTCAQTRLSLTVCAHASGSTLHPSMPTRRSTSGVSLCVSAMAFPPGLTDSLPAVAAIGAVWRVWRFVRFDGNFARARTAPF